MKVYKIGIIGYGGFGRFLHSSWKKVDRVKVVAIADENLSCNLGGDIKFYNNWRDLVKDNEIDIVSIVTPPLSHMEIACEAMDHGKHLLIEKPLTTKVEDGRKLLEKAYKTGRRATVNYMLRFNPLVEILRKLTFEGIFGQLRRVDVENYAQDNTLPKEHWFWDTEISGGILIEHAVHFIDLVHNFTEQNYIDVKGLCHMRNDRQEDQVIANVLYKEGLIATHYHSFSGPSFFESTSVRLHYDLASIDIEGWIPLSGRIRAMLRSDVKEKLDLLPNFKLISSSDLDDKKVYCSGIKYEADNIISGSFNINLNKIDVYSNCVCAIVKDLVKSIENPSHILRVKLEDGLKSLEIAALATFSARDRKFINPCI